MTWTPIIKTPPVIGDETLIAGTVGDGDGHEKRFIDIAVYKGTSGKHSDARDPNNWVIVNDWFEGDENYIVTHWMPLPFLPEESSRKNPWIKEPR